MAAPRYSLYRYGLPAEGTELRRSFLGAATLRLSCLARQDILRTISFSERLRLTSGLSSGMRRTATLHTDLTVAASGRSQFKREIRTLTTVLLAASSAVDRAASVKGGAELALRAFPSVDGASRYEAGAALGMGARLTAFAYRACSLFNSVDGRAVACANMASTLRAFSEAFLTATAYKDIHALLNVQEALALFTALGKHEGRKLLMSDGLTVHAISVKDYPNSITAAAGLFLRAASGYLDQTSLTVRCTIPPGGTLVIDAENYTVTLNGENILYLQEGAWPQLSRELLSLGLSSATGGALEGSVVYQEVYL